MKKSLLLTTTFFAAHMAVSTLAIASNSAQEEAPSSPSLSVSADAPDDQPITSIIAHLSNTSLNDGDESSSSSSSSAAAIVPQTDLSLESLIGFIQSHLSAFIEIFGQVSKKDSGSFDPLHLILKTVSKVGSGILSLFGDQHQEAVQTVQTERATLKQPSSSNQSLSQSMAPAGEPSVSGPLISALKTLIPLVVENKDTLINAAKKGVDLVSGGDSTAATEGKKSSKKDKKSDDKKKDKKKKKEKK